MNSFSLEKSTKVPVRSLWTSLYEGVKWKLCSACNFQKCESDFYVERANKDSLGRWCRLCVWAHSRTKKITEHRRRYETRRRSIPEVRERILRYGRRYDRSEKRAQQIQRYRSRPEIKARIAKYKATFRDDFFRSRGERYGVLTRFAKKRKIVCKITLDQWWTIVSGASCHYCDGSIGLRGHGLDRKDSDRGYTLKNVVPCCARCNSKKHKMSYELFLLYSEFLKQEDKFHILIGGA